jgi:hypothetical protein
LLILFRIDQSLAKVAINQPFIDEIFFTGHQILLGDHIRSITSLLERILV